MKRLAFVLVALTACNGASTETVTATETVTKAEVVMRTPDECVDALYRWRNIARTLSGIAGDAMKVGALLDTPGALAIRDRIAEVGDRVPRTVELSNTCVDQN